MGTQTDAASERISACEQAAYLADGIEKETVVGSLVLAATSSERVLCQEDRRRTARRRTSPRAS